MARMANAEVPNNRTPSYFDGCTCFHGSQGATSQTANNVRDLNGVSTSAAVSNGASETLLRDQLLEEVQTWLSPPNPTTNHDVAREARLEGTAKWFLQGKKFQTWKSAGSLLWIHGKRAFCFFVSMIGPFMVSCFHSGLGQERPLVCRSSLARSP